MTAQELLKSSLRLIGVIAPGETPEADEMQDALSALNIMLDSWSADRLTVPVLTSESFVLVSGTASYTIGSGADFDTARPLRIISAYMTSGGLDYPVKIITREQYNDIIQKSTQGRPEFLWYDNQDPIGTIYVYGTPNAADTLVINSWKALSSIAGLTTEIVLPEGYNRALKYNLAIELTPEYGVTAAPDVREVARKSLNTIKTFNLPKAESSFGFPTSDSNRFSNINGGYY